MTGVAAWQWLLLAAIALAATHLFISWSERRKVRRHFAGREALGPEAFVARHFPPPQQDAARRVLQLLARHWPLDPSRLHPDDRFVRDLRMDALDSLATAELLQDIEEEFGTRIADDEAARILTFRQLVERLQPPGPAQAG
jgi:acyl carrier protein